MSDGDSYDDEATKSQTSQSWSIEYTPGLFHLISDPHAARFVQYN